MQKLLPLFLVLLFSSSGIMSRDNAPVTQGDLKQLIHYLDKRFEQVDKRFEQIDKRFEQIDKRFEQVDKRLDDLKYFMLVLIGISTSITSYFLFRINRYEDKIEERIEESIKEKNSIDLDKFIIALKKSDAVTRKLFKEAIKTL